MKEKLSKIRRPETEDASLAVSIIASITAVAAGLAIGIAVKALQFMAANSTVWWQDFIGELQLDVVFNKFPVWFLFGLAVAVWSWTPLKAAINEFLFFLGVTGGFILAPSVVPGLTSAPTPTIWFIITVLSPVAAYIFWYAKSQSWPSILFDIIIIGLMGAYMFDCGFLYLHPGDFVTDALNGVILLLIFIVLASGVIQFLLTLIGGILLALALGPVI